MHNVSRRGILGMVSGAVSLASLAGCVKSQTDSTGFAFANTQRPQADASGFVLLSQAVPDAIHDIRYFTTYNFVGDRVDGYEEPVALDEQWWHLTLRDEPYPDTYFTFPVRSDFVAQWT